MVFGTIVLVGVSVVILMKGRTAPAKPAMPPGWTWEGFPWPEHPVAKGYVDAMVTSANENHRAHPGSDAVTWCFMAVNALHAKAMRAASTPNKPALDAEYLAIVRWLIKRAEHPDVVAWLKQYGGTHLAREPATPVTPQTKPAAKPATAKPRPPEPEPDPEPAPTQPSQEDWVRGVLDVACRTAILAKLAAYPAAFRDAPGGEAAYEEYESKLIAMYVGVRTQLCSSIAGLGIPSSVPNRDLTDFVVQVFNLQNVLPAAPLPFDEVRKMWDDYSERRGIRRR